MGEENHEKPSPENRWICSKSVLIIGKQKKTLNASNSVKKESLWKYSLTLLKPH